MDISDWKMRLLIGKKARSLTGFKNIPVDRSTPLGNPYVMHREEQREEVCELFKHWFKSQLKEQKNEPLLHAFEEIYYALEDGYYVNLQCHCMPSSCHAESIRNEVIAMLIKNKVVPADDPLAARD